MPPNYRQQQGRPLSRPERKGAIALAGLAVVCAIGAGTWGLTHGFGTSDQQRCVSVVVGSSTGGGTLSQCGERAFSWCKTEQTAPGALGPQVQKACRKAGFLRTG